MKKENFELEGIQYVTYHWKGHKITFLAEDVEVYEWYLLNALEDAIPCYVEQEYRDKDEQELTDKEVKDAVLIGMNQELALYNLRIKEQAKRWQANPEFGYNEKVGIVFFREPQELTDKETAQRHEKKWCILQRMWGRRIPRVICYAVQEKYAERLKKMYVEEYLQKGYDLYFDGGNGAGEYVSFPEDDKSILAEYEEGGIHYYYEPHKISWLWYLMKKADCFCVVEGSPHMDLTSRMVCYAIEPKYNEKVEEVYISKYQDKGYYLWKHVPKID